MNLSVAVCTYNGEKFIKEQILSILHQDLPVNEISLCDDGSTDDTLKIVNEIAAEHTEVVWKIYQNSDNLGVIKNFEKAISLCSGDIIFLADQDDVWRKDKTQRIVDYFNDHQDHDVIFTDADVVDHEGKLLSTYSLLDACLLLPDIKLWQTGLCMEIFMFSNRATGATMAFQKTASDFFLPFDNDNLYLHDYQIAMYGCIHESIGLIDEKLISYRQHGKNVLGVSKENWIYTGESPHPLLLDIIEPVPVRPICQRYDTQRLSFYKKRVKNYHTIMGKIRLIGEISQYHRFYNKYWWIFFVSDLFYGVGKNLRTQLLLRCLKGLR